MRKPALGLIFALMIMSSSTLNLANSPVLEKAIALINKMEDKQAALLLERELQNPVAPPEEKPQIYLYLGIAYFNLLRPEKGEAAFKEAILLDPLITLPAKSAPKIIKAFNEQKRVARRTQLNNQPTSIPNYEPASPQIEPQISEPKITPSTEPRQDKEKKTRSINWPAWTVLGGAVSTGLIGLGLGISAGNDVQKANDVQLTFARATEIYNQGKNKNIAANVCFAVAGAAALTSAILFIYPAINQDHDAMNTSFAILPASGGFFMQINANNF